MRASVQTGWAVFAHANSQHRYLRLSWIVQRVAENVARRFFGVAEPDRLGKGLLQFAHGAWTDALGCRVVPQDLGVGFLSISCPLTPGIRLYGVEVVETGDSMDSKKREENQGFTANPVKTKWGRSSVG